MKIAFSIICILLCITSAGQDWRYVKGKKLYTNLDEAIQNKNDVYNLQLYHRNVEKNKLKFIAEMKNLQYLSITDYDIDSLPVEIFNLPNIRTLDLAKNQFREMPIGIRKLKTLEYLVMYDNEIESVPDWIGELTNLNNLILPRNKIKLVSPSIGKLKKLEYLSLGANEIEFLPEEIGQLELLTALGIGQCNIKQLPTTIGNLRNLESFESGVNQIEIVPESIGNLKKLVSLHLNENKIRQLPKSINNLSKLQSLSLEKNHFEHFDYNFSGLRDLEHFKLSGNWITEFPIFLKFCSKLTQLEITNTQISTIPDWISDLRELNWLILDENKINKIPSAIRSLTKLEVVRFAKNQIDTLPGQVLLLPKLKGLAINNNPIKHLPAELLNAKTLEWFSIQATKVTYEEYTSFRRRIPAKVEIAHDSPYYFEDETKPCYTELPEVNESKVFVKLQNDPYFWGGYKYFKTFLKDNIDSTEIIKIVPQNQEKYVDSVTVKFIVRREGGLSNLSVTHFNNETLKNETVRLMKISCVYWVPSNMGGRNINAWAQLVFTFEIDKTVTMPQIKVTAKNLLPAL